jgi:hypothetical protein
MFAMVFLSDGKEFSLTSKDVAHLLCDETGNVKIVGITTRRDDQRSIIHVSQGTPESQYLIVCPPGANWRDMLAQHGCDIA